MTRTSRTRRLAALSLGLAAALATGGCERTQPGPKPISGTPAATAPGASGPAAPLRHDAGSQTR